MKTRQGVLMAVAAVVAAAVGGLAGWSAGVAKRSRVDVEDSPVVARVGERKITAAELKARMAEYGPMARARLSVTEGKRELLDGMIRTELLAQAARARGLEDDFSVRRRLDEVLAEAFLQKDLEPRRATVDVTDAELRARFEQDKAGFSRPERVRIAHLFLSAPEEPAAQRVRRKAEAEALLVEAREALRKDFHGFAPLVRAKSEDPESRPNGGELTPLTREELSTRLGPELAEAVFAAKTPNQLLDRVIATRAGFHVVRLLEHEPAGVASFEQVQDMLRARVRQEKQARMYEELLGSLKTVTPVEVNTQALTAVVP
jgi:peptidyl-prolyl cis-trans isomerase C